ncbi:hypothetical protein ACOMHN_036699 [Nucella lapillus]
MPPSPSCTFTTKKALNNLHAAFTLLHLHNEESVTQPACRLQTLLHLHNEESVKQPACRLQTLLHLHNEESVQEKKDEFEGGSPRERRKKGRQE